ncbi:hypothetical protein CDEST_03530 [Colletotrichum destructivum]|uniref:C2H2-type domain-containing protein n=1 Tax=Colletotrichum destructivum TaxID=34406 RepID=A0AAX4I532_9PEZI|nr:hypothetical protein CDEST_03530 [Colletotrichum destructivum]
MCKYVTHLRVCNVCSHRDTVLIAERACLPAKKNGAFGSCDAGISSDSNNTRNYCWKCKETIGRVPRPSPALRHVNLHSSR